MLQLAKDHEGMSLVSIQASRVSQSWVSPETILN